MTTKQLPKPFIVDFNAALKEGLDHLPQLQLLLPSPSPEFDLTEYFTHHIDYDLDAKKRVALERFLGFVTANQEASLA